MKTRLKNYQKVMINIETILNESLREKNQRIRALEEEIESLRNVVSRFHLDSRFWVGKPIGMRGNQTRRENRETCKR